MPLVGSVPLQPPEAAQLPALDAFHCSITDAPVVTSFWSAFNVSDGGTTAAIPLPGICVVVCELEVPYPHAVRAPSAAIPRIDFNANADLERRWLRRIELITCLPRLAAIKIYCDQFPRSLLPFIHHHCGRIFIRDVEIANVSPFANYICQVA